MEEVRERATKPYVNTSELLFADDTMLVAATAATLHVRLNLVADAEPAYGFELNTDKVVSARVRSNAAIVGPNGEPIKVKDHAIYLGGLISSDGRSKTEITCRLGEARTAKAPSIL